MVGMETMLTVWQSARKRRTVVGRFLKNLWRM